jgi:hypothetical protein
VPVLKGLFFVVLIASGRAMAADSLVMPVQASPKQLPYNWTGFYFGGNIGYGFGKSQTDAVFSDTGRTPSWLGTASSSPANSIARRLAEALARLKALIYPVLSSLATNARCHGLRCIDRRSCCW